MTNIISTIINAPAGSGKTSLLIKHFLKNPDNSLALTFTTKSHLNLINRVHNIITQEGLEFNAINIYTIDSFLYKIFQSDNSIKIPFKSLISESELNYFLDEISATSLEILYQEPDFYQCRDYLVDLYENNYDKMQDFIKTILKNRSYFLDIYQHINSLEKNLETEYKNYKQNFYLDLLNFIKSNPNFTSLAELIAGNLDNEESIENLATQILTKSGISKRFPIKEKLPHWKDFLDNNPTFVEQLFRYLSIHKLLHQPQNFTTLASSNRLILQIFKLSYAVMMTKFAETEKQDHLNLLVSVRQLLQSNNLLLKNINIKYLLIDEFQDTSIDHYLIILELLRQNPDCPIFFIGDPMQSIYSFRDANLGNFIRIFTNNEPSLHHLDIQSSKLSNNYRSSRKIVEFVNTVFKNQNINSIFFNQIAYSHSIPQKDYTSSEVKLYSTDSTLKAILSIIKNTSGELAILVRKQAQLNKVASYLEENNIVFNATSTTTSKQSPELRNLLILLMFLYEPSKNNALLLLNSFWFDFHINEIVKIEEPFEVAKLATFLKEINDSRYILSWQQLLRLALTSLNDEYISATILDIFLSQLELATEKGIINFDKLNYLLKERSRIEKTEATSNIHLMTIHQAKGLEFDSVIIPFCEEGTKSYRDPIIFYRELNDASPNKTLSLLADTGHHLYEILFQQKKYRQTSEEERIFYVAITRAKQNLFLVEQISSRKQSNSFSSMLPTELEKEEIIFENTTNN